MEQLINDGWSFVKMPFGSEYTQALKASWTPVDLPHDWLIHQANNLYETSDVWYRRILPPEYSTSGTCLIHFDGVYMDCDVLLNSEVIASHAYGYTAFYVDLTGKLTGNHDELSVHIRHRSPNSRWYSGSGIFRDVKALLLPEIHLVPDSLYVVTEENETCWKVTVSAETSGVGVFTARVRETDESIIGEATGKPENGKAQVSFIVLKVRKWSDTEPNLYKLEVTFGEQTEYKRIGFRTLRFDPSNGFFLNGQHTKLKGVCLHHDLGCLGAAFHPKAAARQLRVMKEMGVNALRTSHNPPASAMLDLCDEMGILVVDEAFDMWERCKTDFDYARFFQKCEEQDVALWIRRDRCHPSVIMWSIGNEIYDMHADDRGRQVAVMLAKQVRSHDPEHHAEVTFGSNYMPWEGAQRCAEEIPLPGYNYGEKYYASHHAKHPDWVIYGSETASMLFSRGIYHFPKHKNILSDVDLQCSSLGNSTSSWGAAHAGHLVCDDMNIPWTLGQFLWSGTDYIGEPTPYHTRSCYFGMTDTACFPKDIYYLFQSQWTDSPMIHIGVNWDWNPGQMIDINIMTNAQEAELLLNGESLGREKVIRGDAERCMLSRRIPFTPGELTARGFDSDGNLICEEKRVTSGDGKRLKMTAEDQFLLSDGEDITFVTVTMEDADGNPVENARNRVNLRICGGGRLMGTDNGDPTDTEEYRSTSRRLFGGKLLAIIGSDGTDEPVTVEACSPGRESCRLTIPVIPVPRAEGTSCVERIPETSREEICVRRVEILSEDGTVLSPEHPTCSFRWKLLPADADTKEVQWQVTNESGIESPCAEVEITGDRVKLTARGDGTVLLRALCGNAPDHPEIISQLEIRICGFGNAALDPYHFVSAGLYDLSEGDIGAGNEQGIAFARDGFSMVGFSRVDFGTAGSDTVTLPIFALDGNVHEILMWIGDPREKDSELLTVLKYQKPSIWNEYQSETYVLPRRLTGIKTLCFTMNDKVHLKGFLFEKQSRAYTFQNAAEADRIWGDSYRQEPNGVFGIGNNVTLCWDEMDFGNSREVEIVLRGQTPLEKNAITFRAESETGKQCTELIMFRGNEKGEQTFRISTPGGLCSISFIFLPGCRFDFFGFEFRKIREDS